MYIVAGRELSIVAAAMACLSAPGAGAEAVLETALQQYSYVAGFQIGQSLMRDGTQLDTEAFVAAIRDVLSGADIRMTREQMLAVLEQRREKRSAARGELLQRKRAEEAEYLAANRGRAGVVELANGIQYRVLAQGQGDRPAKTSMLKVHYRGTLLDGSEFDSSYRRGEPVSLRIGQVIQGWRDILPRMAAGSKWQVVIPARLGYGDEGAGAAVGPGETLLFDIELLSVD